MCLRTRNENRTNSRRFAVCTGVGLPPVSTGSAFLLKTKKPGRLRKPVRFLDSVSLLVRQRLRLPRKTPSHSKRAKGSTQQHHCCASVGNRNTTPPLRRKRMAVGPSLANRREHHGTNRCNEQGDFSGGNQIHFHKQQRSNRYATTWIRFRQHRKVL